MPACTINIGRRERRVRRAGGWSLIAAALVAGLVLIAAGAFWAWRVALFVPLMTGAIGVLQGREAT